jgi:hypothetical protein
MIEEPLPPEDKLGVVSRELAAQLWIALRRGETALCYEDDGAFFVDTEAMAVRVKTTPQLLLEVFSTYRLRHHEAVEVASDPPRSYSRFPLGIFDPIDNELVWLGDQAFLNVLPEPYGQVWHLIYEDILQGHGMVRVERKGCLVLPLPPPWELVGVNRWSRRDFFMVSDIVLHPDWTPLTGDGHTWQWPVTHRRGRRSPYLTRALEEVMRRKHSGKHIPLYEEIPVPICPDTIREAARPQPPTD